MNNRYTPAHVQSAVDAGLTTWPDVITMLRIELRKYILTEEPYGYSLRLVDENPDTRYLPPVDTRSTARKVIDRLILGMAPVPQE